jgi:hypothetical protein
MRRDTSRAAMCLVKKPKSVTMPGVCPSILITHWLGNRGQHLLWRHLRGVLYTDRDERFRHFNNIVSTLNDAMHKMARVLNAHPLHTAPSTAAPNSGCYWPCRNPCLFDVELATNILCIHFSAYTLHTQRDLDDYIHDSTNYRKKIISSTSARCKVRPSTQFLIIPPASFADNPFTYVHEVAFEMM